jgi:hypothetical protein
MEGDNMKLVFLSSKIRLDIDAVEGYFPHILEGNKESACVVIIRRGISQPLTLTFENSAIRDQCLHDLDIHLNPTR